MRTALQLIAILLLTLSSLAQGKRVWVLQGPDEMVEYDLTTFAVKQRVKVPSEAAKSSGSLEVNRLGQMSFAPPLSSPLSQDDISAPHKVWIWDGHAATTIDQGVERKVEDRGSNQAVTESAPTPYLSADGKHLFWFANEMRRLQREDVDLSTITTWLAWRTGLSGAGREELVSTSLPDCRCPTGSCEESCPTGIAWAPDEGVDKFFLMTQFVAGKDTPVYKASAIYKEEGGKWSATTPADPLPHTLDAVSDGSKIVYAIPDTGCCGWSNQSNDQTLVLANGKHVAAYDEQATYKNPDYDVSFYTPNARLSPEMGFVAMTVAATAQANKAIQLSEDGEANPEESQRIRKALAELPAVAVKTLEDTPQQTAFLPHATFVGWISEKELLIIEDHLLVAYNVATKARRKSTVRVDDAARVFLR